MYRHISECPLYLFIDALVDEKIHSIVVSGNPDEQQIGQAWAELLMQFHESMGDNESRMFFSLHKQILQKEIDLKQVSLALAMLAGDNENVPCFIPQLLTFLNELFYSNLELYPDDPEDYYHKLNIFRNKSASIRMNIDMKRIQYDSISDKRKGAGQKPDRPYFQTILLNLSGWRQYEINDRISVFEFCELVNRLNKYLETVK